MCDIKDAVVLIIDDCEDNLFLMEMVLLQDGYKVEKACCGKDGIEKIHKLVPDLIILDMMMPDMTGFEVVEHIKPYKNLASIPILLCTANKFIHQLDIEKIEEINDVCYKPYDICEILTKIDSLVACCGDAPNSALTMVVGESNFPSSQDRQRADKFGARNLFLENLLDREYAMFTQ